ncbi:hypothetical protein P280DRAFT_80241 [Massarina eburnea CBS 473.64]|uniref:RanBD1 domain-containing protein n=1 Tax=Massarina eburnea CBS 473.64 TaxID=1395130 RepID=A0A6A6RVN6_9PLEO|nr:hypothetical protein P280DRAFT_80241 [Massarina eburnea CBS 473.64]
MPALTAAAAPPSEAPKASEVLSNTPKNQASGVSFEAPKPEVPAESAKTSEELFNAPKTGGVSSEAPKAGQLPRIPRAHVPATWVAPKAMQTDLQALTVQLLSLNNQYRSKLISLSPTADWSPLSQWHAKATTEIMQKIVTAKKQLAAAKGVTGNESSLSVKRKAVANDDAADLAYDASPSKKQREAKMPATPVSKTSSLFSTTPKDTPPSETSNLFGSVFNKDTGATTSNLFGSVSNKSVAETSEKSGMASKDDEPTKAATPQTGFSFTNSTATTTPKPAASQSLFQMPSASSSSKTNVTAPAPTTASQNGFSFGKSTATAGPKPAASQSLFKMPTPSSGGPGSGFSLIGQFSTKAKSYEELVAERKAKDKDNDYDSDDEDYEEWSTRWDKEEAARVAKDKEATTTDDASTTPKGPNKGFNFLSGVSQPTVGTSGTSSSGLFSPRVASPAPSTGGQSVFDTPEAAQSPASNIFGHLSGGQSSSQDDESDDDDADDHDNDNDNGDNDAYDDDDSGDEREEQEEPYESDIQPTKQSSSEQAQPKKRKVFSSDTESDEETGSGKRPAMFKKPSLADRMTHEASKATDESEKENGNPNPVTSTLFGQANGFQTPVKKPFFFDFAGAGAKTAPPKQDSSAGDQTFKAGTPIKFGSAAKTTPAFQFQPATPGLAEFSATPAKPGPATFSFLNAPNTSNAGSVFSSRAATPLSEPDVSGKESAAGNDDEESEQHAQIDLSGLTAEEKAVYDVIFHADQALCKHQVETGGKKVWENYARGPLWILKNKETGKAIVRMRLSTGTTMLNYNIFPKVKTAVTGSSKKMVSAIGTKKDGKSGNMFFAVKSSDIATEFSNVYNANLPS